MNSALVAKAILDRIKADTGSGGLFSASGGTAFNLITGAYRTVASPGTRNTPYLVYAVEWTNNDTQNTVGGAFKLNMSVYDSATSGDANINAIETRLAGDASVQATRRPSFGFHQHLLVLDTGATNPYSLRGGEVVCDGGSITPDDVDVVRLDMSFTFHIEGDKA